MAKQEVRRPDIEAVFDHYELRIVGGNRGGWRKAQCPLPDHDDTNPSASVDTDEGKFWCHACAEGGDSLDIIQRREGLAGYLAAVEFAARVFDSQGHTVGRERGSTSLLPRSQGSREGRRNWQPPWTRL